MRMCFANLTAICFGLLIMLALQCSAATDERISLAGQWRFELDINKSGITESWFKKSLPEVVKLPGSMDQNKKGTPNIREPNMSHLSRLFEYTGPAWYQRQIDIPAAWKGRHITLFLERCHWETQVWLDGKQVGGMQDSLCVPHIYDLGTDVERGRHRLTIRVDNTVKYYVGDMAHCITEETQTNWNGIIGRIELHSAPSVRLENVQVYPDVAVKTIKIKALIHSESEVAFDLYLAVTPADKSKLILLHDVGFTGEKAIEAEISMGENVKLWDEFSPNLYELITTLTVSGQKDISHTTFGMRNIGVTNKRIVVNGRNICIRGTLECCIFPRTGYPATDVDSWLRIFKICKSYGLNSMRFHSWCPPEAAFVAADRMGFMMQVEAPLWVGNIGGDKPRDEYIGGEVRRILDTYGNHPSFAMMCMGNELRGDATVLQDLIRQSRERDPRHIYTSSAAFPFGPEDMYFVNWLTRGLHGPSTDFDFSTEDAKAPNPTISHEVGQWAVYPNIAEIPKYKGVLRASNFELLRESLRKNHLLNQAPLFTQASGKFSAELYKEEIEVLLRTPRHCGFQLLDLHDFPGQGTATVGMLDAFWDSKGIITPAEFRRFCSHTVPLLRMPKRTYTTDETFTAKAEITHFGPTDIANAIPMWTVTDSNGTEIASGLLPARNLPTGDLYDLGTINMLLNRVKAPTQLTVTVSLKDTNFFNEWHIWVYPAKVNTTPPADVFVTQSTEEALLALDQGRKVLMLASSKSLAGARPGTFTGIFWCPSFLGQAAGGMGILCDPTHPALAEFPTDAYSNWQWYDLLTKSYTMALDGTPPSFRPTVQVIDNFIKNQKLGNLLEAKVGKGRLVLCSIDVFSDLDDRPVARQLLSSILSYMGSSTFEPRQSLTITELGTIICKSRQSILASLGAVATVDSEAKECAAQKAIDGDPDSIWHVQWEDANPPYPHELRIDAQKSIEFSGFRYLPRQWNDGGWITNYEFYVSENGTNWGEPVARGTFTLDQTEKIVSFEKPVNGRYLRLVALKGHNDQPWAAIAEFDVIQ